MEARELTVSLHELSSLPLFQDNELSELEWLLEYCHVLSVGPDTLLLSPDTWNDALYLVLDGEVNIELELGGRQTITTLGPGSCIGELSVIEQTLPIANVRTRTHCKLLMIDSGVIHSLISRSHIIVRNLLGILSQRLKNNTMELIEARRQKLIYENNSNFDALTGIYNRRWLDNALVSFISRSIVDANPLSLLMLDIDHFKRYNDEHGHLKADQALASTAQAIANKLRPDDVVARYGGEEFVVVLPHTGIERAQCLAERLRLAVEENTVTDKRGNSLQGVTISVGITLHRIDQDQFEFLNDADQALYRAKHKGRNIISV
jgi:diguanylate cyclase (GGDEF)-like protein